MGCSNDEFSTGTQFFKGISFELTSWDTLSLEMSTVKFDSVVTSSPSRLLIGQMQHPDYGQLVSSSYLELTPDSTGYLLDASDDIYDSVTLVLTYDNYYLNDTTTEFSLEVFEVTEEMETDDENEYFYNTSSFTVNSVPLGSKSVIPTRPFGSGTIEITLSDELGQKFYNEALDNNNVYSSSAQFQDFFKGIKIAPNDPTNSFLGFSTSAAIRLYYTDTDVIPSEQKYISFSNQSVSEIYFNHFDEDFAGTILDGFSGSEIEEIPSNESNHLLYMQSGMGLGIRIEIPSIKSIQETNPELLIENVTLKLKPIMNQYTSDEELPEELYVYYVDDNNQLIYEDYMTMTLSLDEEFDIDTYYYAEISDFFDAQLEEEENNNNALLISTIQETNGSNAHYLILGDQKNTDYQAEIKLNTIQLK